MAKKAIRIYLKSAIESGFDFIKRRFNSVDELNKNFQRQRNWIFEKLEKKADYKRRLVKVLEILKMYSCKYVGISFLTENSLCEAYEKQFGEAISKRTVTTCMKNLRDIEFITSMPAKREDGKQTASIIVIEKLCPEGEEGASDVPVKRKGATKPHEGSAGAEGSETLAYKEEENLRTEKTISLTSTSLRDSKERIAKERRLLNFVPKWFKDAISCCAREGGRVFEFYKVAKHLGAKYITHISREKHAEVATAAVREFYRASKAANRGAFKMGNPYGFFHSVLEAESLAHIRREAQASSSLYYDWLNQD